MVSLAAALGIAAFAFSLPPVGSIGLPGSGLTRLTGSSPFPASCEARGAQRASEVEPSIAAGPGVLVAAWQQDRYLHGAAAGIGVAVSHDGGDSWQRVDVPRITDCTPAFDHASDPWVSVGADGTVYLAALVGRPDRAGFRTRVAISASRDGGATWPAPTLLDAGGNGFNDKPSVSADPARPARAYAVWTLEGQAYLARTRDAGRSWSPPRLVERARRGTGLLSSTIAVLPGADRLLHTFIAYGRGGFRLEATRSPDGGSTWSSPSLIAALARRPPGRPPVRVLPISGTGAAAAGAGLVYEAFVERGVEVDVASSGDGGRTWSQPRVVARQDRGVFGPSLAGVPGGALAATYYGREMRGTASFWIATSRDGTRWQRRRLAAPFDLTRAPRSDGAAFLGDYSGLTAVAGGGFAAAFAVSPPLATDGSSDVLVARDGG
jgi:hypothetical protein